MFLNRLVFASIFIVCCLTTFTLGATLADDEVEALKIIGRTLGKTNWIDPCNQEKSSSEYYANNVTCDCSFNDGTTCHVVNILLKAQNLSGTLPPDLNKLPFLQEIDLTRNYLSGTIPPEWGSMKLVSISLLGNRLTGQIPEELGNLSNLTSLVLEHNGFSGTLPSSLGSLSKIERMLLNSNNLSGELPETFANLTTMKEFRISDNNFTGNIPDFIFQNWTNLEELYMEASGLSGPIPSIGSSETLKYIIISDLNGAEAPFPQHSTNLPKIDRMMLRSCNLFRELPASLGALTTLKILDLSFNRFSGVIPNNLSALTNLDQLFLTGNNFNGEVPQWILDTKERKDLSYNNFTSPIQPNCRRGLLNLFASTSRINNSGIVPCLRDIIRCPAEPLHFLYINCGGQPVTVNGSSYEGDYGLAGPSTFYRSSTNWGFSNTGIFIGDNQEDAFIVENEQLSNMTDAGLYTDARRSPNSLTYYAYCLDNATFSVNLHFAEIQFTDGENYSSLGRRLFDVYIQGKQVLKDFNIMDKAGGAGKPKVKNFTVNVTDGTLEIHLRWAGKGTTSIPSRGIYGPLISAISIFDPGYKPPSGSDSGISAAVVGGIVGGAAFATLLIGAILWWNGCLTRKSTLEQDLKGIELQTSSFSLRQIKAATNNFDAANKIGEGGFGPVYKGILADGTAIAVKQLSARSKQGNREFVTEIGMISALQHPHLVKLYGCCIEGNQLLLIYEYLENNSLARALFGPQEFQLKLDWPTRRKICIGIARGLAYLHEESRLKIVHRDIKATNVLLDKNLNPKISDFGLAKLDEEDNTHISTRIAGTYGYMAPEYAMHGHLTDKADVYSFGIVALEIVSGKCNTKTRAKEEPFYILDWDCSSLEKLMMHSYYNELCYLDSRQALDKSIYPTQAHVLKEKGNLLDLVDARIGSDCNIDEVMTMINVALLCTNPTAAARPSMSSVVSMLEGKASVQEFFADSSISSASHQLNAEAMKKLYEKLEENDADISQTKSMLADGPWTSSTSAADLYPVNLSSTYWQNRDSTS